MLSDTWSELNMTLTVRDAPRNYVSAIAAVLLSDVTIYSEHTSNGVIEKWFRLIESMQFFEFSVCDSVSRGYIAFQSI